MRTFLVPHCFQWNRCEAEKSARDILEPDSWQDVGTPVQTNSIHCPSDPKPSSCAFAGRKTTGPRRNSGESGTSRGPLTDTEAEFNSHNETMHPPAGHVAEKALRRFVAFFTLCPLGGEMAEWFKAHAWKACVGNTTGGSNPSLSATSWLRALSSSILLARLSC